LDYTYNTALYEPQVGTYYEGRPERKDRLRAGVLLPESESLAGEVFRASSICSILALEVFTFTLKGFLGSRRFKSNAEVKDVFKEGLIGLAAEVYGEDNTKTGHRL
jgi:hypothetical protein